MEMIDLRSATSKNGECKTLKKYKGFSGTIKSIQITNTVAFEKQRDVLAEPKLYVATCGLDRFLRIHNVQTGQLIKRMYLKSRANCLLFSRHVPAKIEATQKSAAELEDDQLSHIYSEDVATDEIWSDMETIREEFPDLGKSKLEKRLEDFSHSEDEDDNEQETKDSFKKPKYLSAYFLFFF